MHLSIKQYPALKSLHCAMQVLAADMCYLFDMLVTDTVAQDAVHKALKDLMEDQNIMKISHDCGRFAAALRDQLSVILRTTFDTQVKHVQLLFWHEHVQLNSMVQGLLSAKALQAR